MNREAMLINLESTQWDMIIIGGGSTGLGAAVDAASRGYRTLLLEKYDFAKGTSSRSTKLLHGGVRYLAQGNIKLVMEALKERGLILKNAPHLTSNLPFIVPSYKWWEKWYYGAGLRIYDILSGKLSLGKTTLLSKSRTLHYLPLADPVSLYGGVLYHDGQFDDARLAINLAQTAVENGATILNYAGVVGLLKSNGKINGVVINDSINKEQYEIKARIVINATGVFTDEILKMDDQHQHHLVKPSQGVHLVIDKKFFPGHHALMIPKTEDGRVLFAVPWHDKVVLGTTDTPVEKALPEPRALKEEIEFIIRHFNKYMTKDISAEDVRSVFAGLRPLVKVPGKKNTAIMPRDHTIVVSPNKMVTITGGKWTTYRKMAKDAVDRAVKVGELENRDCVTENLHVHGWMEEVNITDPLHFYGSDAEHIRELMLADRTLTARLHPNLIYCKGEVIWAIRNEMAMTVEDVLARRTRSLFLDARAAMEAAPEVASLMAKEMKKDETWEKEQVESFTKIASGYLLSSFEPKP
jgi:glycerol-3-phosphate dehydrogenase